jgi:hypothetical protein
MTSAENTEKDELLLVTTTAEMFLAGGGIAKAEDLLKTALNSSKQRLGEQHPLVGRVLANEALPQTDEM